MILLQSAGKPILSSEFLKEKKLDVQIIKVENSYKEKKEYRNDDPNVVIVLRIPITCIGEKTVGYCINNIFGNIIFHNGAVENYVVLFHNSSIVVEHVLRCYPQ